MYDEACDPSALGARLIEANRAREAQAGAAPPALSVLIPSFRDDASGLIGLLAREAGGPVGFEIIVLDDGSARPDLQAAMQDAVRTCAAPAALYAFSANQGRAAARNALTGLARGRHLLFLDADMAPDAPDFLSRYLPCIEADEPIVFGGFSVEQVAPDRQTALHHYTTRISDCLSAAERPKDAAGRGCTSNLLVRPDVLKAEPFDAGFTGWGWEDVEWALRASMRWPVRHIDNAATHLGLDPAAVLLRKYSGSGANYAAMAARHPQVAGFRLYRLAMRLSAPPLLSRALPLASPLLAGLVLGAGPLQAPLPLRALALKLHRAIALGPHLRAIAAPHEGDEHGQGR